MHSILVQAHQPVAGHEPAVAGAAAPARLNSAQLRELSAQWRRNAGDDPQRAQRIADVLDWLAAQRERPAGAHAALHRVRERVSAWMRP